MMGNKVIYEKRERSAYITLNRPEKLNAIDDAMYEAIRESLERAEADSDVMVVVLEGNGTSFCAGADLSSEMVRVMPPPRGDTRFMGEYYAWDEQVRHWWQYLFRMTKMTICSVQGYALGWGCDMAMMCDISIVAENACMGDPSIRMGFATNNPLWTWRVGPRLAKELLLTGRSVSGREAQKMGLVTRWVPDDFLKQDVEEAVQSMLNRGGMVGYDGRWLRRRGWGQVAESVSGIDTAWQFTSNFHAMSSIQRRGFEIDEFDFYRSREVEGLKAAIRRRDEEWKELFSDSRDRESTGVARGQKERNL